ncbi:hypothetical protein WJX81_001893 [Elliptochloris bilobata]|uniref:Uncharacterized protein n=1 Tax=Elliptochloris bilobata TaxID=381761 RepID=A0AAW1S5V2_9CHLO
MLSRSPSKDACCNPLRCCCCQFLLVLVLV